MAILDLPTSPFTACWDLTRDRVLADEALRAARVRCEFAEDVDAIRPVEQMGAEPTVQVFGSLGRVQWHHEQQTEGALILVFRAYLPSLDPRDAWNLHAALEQALYPDDGLAYQRALADAGATTGLWVWLQPMNAVKSDLSRCLIVAGQAGLAVRSPILSC